MKRIAPEKCPACGSYVPPRALACPECGADENTGWNEEAMRYDGLDLPEDSSKIVEIFPDEGRMARFRPKGVPWHWWVVAIVLLAIMACLLIAGKW